MSNQGQPSQQAEPMDDIPDFNDLDFGVREAEVKTTIENRGMGRRCRMSSLNAGGMLEFLTATLDEMRVKIFPLVEEIHVIIQTKLQENRWTSVDHHDFLMPEEIQESAIFNKYFAVIQLMMSEYYGVPCVFSDGDELTFSCGGFD